ncbi:hypothetical protein SRABI106_04770 [Rahnella aquatilis]|nr:hypothetical protein SRABI106_04770 [Rahnella aquatilis]
MQTWNDLLFHHHFKFGRYTGREENLTAVELHAEAAGGAHRIIQQLGIGRDLCLFAVGFGHRTATFIEERLHGFNPASIFHQFHITGFSRRQRT